MFCKERTQGRERERGKERRVVAVSIISASATATEVEEDYPLSSCDKFYASVNSHTIKDKDGEEKETKPVAVVVDKRDESNMRKIDETFVIDNCQTTPKITTTEASSRKGYVIETTLIAEKSLLDFEKLFKTHTELDVKVAEDMGRYLGPAEEALSPHGRILGKDLYGLSIGYDSILRNELPNEKVDDEYILSELQLYHLDPLTRLSPHAMMVAGEMLPSTSDQSMLNGVENHVRNEIVGTHVGVVTRTGQRSGNETIDGKSTQFSGKVLRTDLSAKNQERVVRDEKVRVRTPESTKDDADESQERSTVVTQSSGNPVDLLVGDTLLAPIEKNPSSAMAQSGYVQRYVVSSSQGVPGDIIEQLKLKTRVKLEPRIIKKRRRMSERLDRRTVNKPNNNENNDVFRDYDGSAGSQQDDAMAVVSISTDKTSDMTQIVIDTGRERQVYQSKTSELIEATGSLPTMPKIDTSTALRNGFDSSSPSSSQYEIVLSKALEELGITDDSLRPVRVTEHDKVWLCPQEDCNRQFGKLYTLKGHLLVHYGVRPFKVRRIVVISSYPLFRLPNLHPHSDQTDKSFAR